MVSLISRVRGFKKNYTRLSWQAKKNNSFCKANLITPELERLECKSVLDIGCNAGQVSRELCENRFVVGLDQKLDLNGFQNPLNGVALGEFTFSSQSAKLIPKFDAVLLLSVHHQWYAGKSKLVADEIFQQVISIANKAVFIEFAALNSKYGDTSQFTDNDENSIKYFAYSFLEKFSPKEKIKFLGSCPESSCEPVRYMFMIDK